MIDQKIYDNSDNDIVDFNDNYNDSNTTNYHHDHFKELNKAPGMKSTYVVIVNERSHSSFLAFITTGKKRLLTHRVTFGQFCKT